MTFKQGGCLQERSTSYSVCTFGVVIQSFKLKLAKYNVPVTVISFI